MSFIFVFKFLFKFSYHFLIRYKDSHGTLIPLLHYYIPLCLMVFLFHNNIIISVNINLKNNFIKKYRVCWKYSGFDITQRKDRFYSNFYTPTRFTFTISFIDIQYFFIFLLVLMLRLLLVLYYKRSEKFLSPEAFFLL